MHTTWTGGREKGHGRGRQVEEESTLIRTGFSGYTSPHTKYRKQRPGNSIALSPKGPHPSRTTYYSALGYEYTLTNLEPNLQRGETKSPSCSHILQLDSALATPRTKSSHFQHQTWGPCMKFQVSHAEKLQLLPKPSGGGELGRMQTHVQFPA